ncbi:transposase [Metabacillus sp. KIGAM252]|uniref:Transposase n=1 Tax=Metabacillus flavus TaxID=2823519 RepID=A0ABS5LJU8_9BACI|nr:transposase [Metabacillus flavus]MBS2970758.1 transposase [Metabacillus flavus]
MKKYSAEYKKKVIKFYHDHADLGYLSVAREFGIPSDETVRRWIKKDQMKEEPKPEKQQGQTTRRCLPSGWPKPRTLMEEKAFSDAENAYLKKLLALRKEGR